MMLLIPRKAIIKYAVMPQIRSRMRDLFASGFHYIPYFIALVYATVRLLPAHHPYVNAANIGRFGIRHVISEAANNLVISTKNIDQIVLFVCILVGMVLVFVQLCMLGLSIFLGPAIAATIPVSFAGFFLMQPAAEEQNLAGMMLDMVFGVPEIFNSCISTSVFCEDMNNDPILDIDPLQKVGPLSPNAHTIFPFPIHAGLHQMFQLYSLGLLFVAVLITSYFIITILAETAQTGTPFGKRFNKVWAPIRIVVAFGLLIPVGYGLNSSQYIVLYAAKFGSGFANNGWLLFNQSISDSFLGNVENLVSTPNTPEVSGLLQLMYVAKVCSIAELQKNQRAIRPYLVRSPTETPPSMPVHPGTGYDAAMTFAKGETILTMVFGTGPDQNEFGRYKGFVKPFCGEITITLHDPRNVGVAEPAAELLQEFYWNTLRELWYETSTVKFGDFPENTVKYYGPWEKDTTVALPDQALKGQLVDEFEDDIEPVLAAALAAQATSPTWDMDQFIEKKGWGGAGVWYNRVAEMNGSMNAAVFNLPKPSKYPFVMEYIKHKKEQADQETFIDNIYQSILANGEDIPHLRPEDPAMSRILFAANQFWQNDDGASTTHSDPTGNIIVDTINLIFGTDGLYSMRRNTNVHPLAQLVGVGRALVESSIRNLGVATLGGAGGSIAGIMKPYVGSLSAVASQFLITIAGIGLTAGFVLYYVVPFLPFIYFYFAVGGWVKGIFEAMVGAPLWALAHLRIDGNGLPGQAAVSGYFLIFEIFLRPILIIFGMLASISVFSALVTVLNQTFDLVTKNLTGFDVGAELTNVGPTEIEYYRAPVDEFFFTVIYTIIVYLMAMSSFKLIDMIPNNILRWMGQSVATFNDQREDAASSLVGTASVGAQQTLSNVGGGLKSLFKG
ncbi:MAG: hypothetical protein DHS20C02_13430 [Micavibrio sp.]|nr:MAG: hypothetical protein DHS20C02_13430 [Micavibrio sp.]